MTDNVAITATEGSEHAGVTEGANCDGQAENAFTVSGISTLPVL